MAIPTVSYSWEQDREIWQTLKETIANSSGFQCWQEETNKNLEVDPITLEEQVQGYLRSTLETLAY
jgi:uncharacterized membrane protein affecting hemolysin expression